ncbi:MAG: acyl-CoA reductase [Chitinophagaceae bacterium]|nr:acyl-CoA reductase [Chitinophagaceae bacterium]
MILQERIAIMVRLGGYMAGREPEWEEAKQRAARENPWFIPEFVQKAVASIVHSFLEPSFLQDWAGKYDVPVTQENAKTVGLVMAGNIPLVGFHDLLCVFISGHKLMVKPSSKDEVLIRHLVQKLESWEPAVSELIGFAERLKGCDAYIATGSNNSGRYFEYYFGKYPHIIRKNRTSVAVLDGTETREELEALAEDIMLYFGLGCRNITKLYVPREYDFIPLLDILRRYDYFMEYHKYKHNYDYHLALLMMGNKFYMTNDTVILTENSSPFSPVSQVHYEFYEGEPTDLIPVPTDIQCVAGQAGIAFGRLQQPALDDYADGVDTMEFLLSL